MSLFRNVTIPKDSHLAFLAVSVQADFLEPHQPVTSQRSFAESQTRLPCQYQEEGDGKVVQVSWYKELPDGTKDQIITAHYTAGHTGTRKRLL